MKTNLSVLNSNSINRYGYRFSVGALESGLWQKAVIGMPTNIGHDMHRPIGWTIPFGLYFQPGLVRSTGKMLFAETDEDTDKIRQAHNSTTVNHYHKEYKKHEDKFEPLVKEHLSKDEKIIYCGTTAIVDKNIIERIFPELIELKDKDSLIYLTDLFKHFTYKKQGVFFHKKSNLAIFAHSYFRRSLSRHNNFHYIFLDQLIEQHKNEKVKVRIAIDFDMIGYATSYSDSHELEYWWGPKYSDDISQIPIGLTTHKCNDFEKKYYGISTTEFFWKIHEGNHEFELEELKEEPAPSLDEDHYGCRYIHSIFKDSEKTFEHFDGAIRMYDGELMLERIGKSMTDFGRRSQYTKLFRLDGEISLDNWKSLTTNYLQGNPLIYEYFNIQKPDSSHLLEEHPTSLKEKLIPYSINENDGIRILVSYHAKNESLTDERIVSIFDELELDDGIHRFLEYDIIEIKKALNRINKDLTIPKDVTLGYAEDLYWNIPAIFHGLLDPQNSMNDTMQAISMLVTAMNNKKKNKIISFTLCWNMDDKEVRVSILGHSTDIFNWLVNCKSIPTSRDKFIIWLESQSKYLENYINKNSENPNLFRIVHFDGVLYMHRKPVALNATIEYKNSERGVGFELSVPSSNVELANAIENNIIIPVPSCIAKKVTCSITNSDYWTSPYSAILDDNVVMHVEDFQFMGLYWTDRSA